MATEIKTPRFTTEQKEAWLKAKYLLKHSSDPASCRALHIAMSELRAEQGRKHKGPIETLAKHDGKLTEYKSILIRDQIAARVAEWKQFLRDPGSKKLFIVLDPTLSAAQKAVQAAHCAAEFQKQHPHAPWVNGTMVLLEPDTEHRNWKFYQESCTFGKVIADPFESFIRHTALGVAYRTLWSEPDLGNRLTAVALLSDYRNADISKVGVKLI